MKSSLLSIILPTYNEAENIIPLIKTISKNCKKSRIPVEIIVVDDNSPDQTAEIVRNEFRNDPSIQTFIRHKDQSLAKSIYFGITKAKGFYLLVMDTDFNHDPKEIPRFYHLVQQYDFVVGSRYMEGGGMENRRRYLLSNLFNIFLQIFLSHSIHDSLSGFFAVKTKLIKKGKLHKPEIYNGFGDYFIRLVFHAHQHQLTLIETPVFYANRLYGYSKSKFLKMFITYTRTAFELRFNRPSKG